MNAIFLSESDVSQLIDMDASIQVVEECFRNLHSGKARNTPRQRTHAPGILLHSLEASAEYLGTIGWKNYTTTKQGARFHVAIYDCQSGKMQALIEADYLGQLRTGAASGVATRFLADEKARTVGMFGAGKQAATQLEAVCSVREIQQAKVYCRDEKRRADFAEKMSAKLNISVEPADSPDETIQDQDIVITATNTREAIFDGKLLKENAHINAAGCNFWKNTEIDTTTVSRSSRVVCDSIEQCKLEAGDLRESLEQGLLSWEEVQELSAVVSGEAAITREQGDGLTLFKSVGLGIEDVAMGTEILKRAREKNIGQELPF